MALKSPGLWERSGCPYQQASLFRGNEADKKRALTLMQQLAPCRTGKAKTGDEDRWQLKASRGNKKVHQSNPAC